MAQSFTSSAPGIFTALQERIEEVAREQTPPVQVFPFAVGLLEPQRYIELREIANHEWQPETLGFTGAREDYEIVGRATTFVGDSAFSNIKVATDVMTETWALFNACVMGAVVSNRTNPFLGTTGPEVQIMYPLRSDYSSRPGTSSAGGQIGRVGTVDWAFRFTAIIVPA